MSFPDLLKTLSLDEQREVSAYINFSRKLRSQGYRPVVASSKGSVAKFLTGDDNSLIDFIDELLKPDILASISIEDPVLKEKLRVVKKKKEMLNFQGQSWKTVDVAHYLGISIQAVSKKRKAGKLLGLSLGARGYVFPCWQFTNNDILFGLSESISILQSGAVGDWDKLAFFISENPSLNNKTPIECLKRMDLEPVKLAAKLFDKP